MDLTLLKCSRIVSQISRLNSRENVFWLQAFVILGDIFVFLTAQSFSLQIFDFRRWQIYKVFSEFRCNDV